MLMLPNMYKIAGELTATVFHVAARSVATQALSIFGDHSDVMAARTTGFALLSSASVQEAHDNALIAQAATLETRIPFMHFFDGFRTSHEINTLALLGDDQIRAMIDPDLVRAHRKRALDPEHPFVRGTAHNPDTFFQARESVNPFYARVPAAVQSAMDRFAALTGRQYHLFDYAGPPDAERVVVAMGTGAETARETRPRLAGARRKGRRHPSAALPALCRRGLSRRGAADLPGARRDRADQGAGRARRAALSRCRGRAGAGGCRRRAADDAACHRRPLRPCVKDFNPAMAKAVFDELAQPEPRNGFTIGIEDDVSHTSLAYDRSFTIEPPEVVRAVFYGLGADGTVGANKNSVKIIAEEAGLYAQGYFVYDLHKSGAQTISHLRFGPRPIRAPYLIRAGQFCGLPPVQFHRARRMCCRSQRRGAPSSSTAPMVPTRCGTICRARCSSRSSSGGFASS